MPTKPAKPSSRERKGMGMPKIRVEIEWDWPDEEFWLNADNIAIALHQVCTKTNFKVTELDSPPTETPCDHTVLQDAEDYEVSLSEADPCQK